MKPYQKIVDALVFKALEAKQRECKCGKCGKLSAAPDSARFSDDEFLGGYYWECVCQSTIFSPLAPIRKKAA